MSNPLCRYCGKPMEIDNVDYYGTTYECSCDDYKKDIALQKEISEIDRKLLMKKIELDNHRNQSIYKKRIKEVEQILNDINKNFNSTWP